MESNTTRQLFQGRFISVIARGNWEYVTRNTQRPAVGIVALTEDGKVLLVEQHRPPLGQRLLELPAGLSGDLAGAEDEALLEAAQRELEEETGYVADRWTELATVSTSPGLTDEQILLFLAEGLRRSGPGGGDASESIAVHEVPLVEVYPWLLQQHAVIDMKLLAGLFAASQTIARRDGATS